MRRNRGRALAWLALSAVLWAEDWPQFRGPTGQGLSSEKGLPEAWSEKQNIRWRTAIPGKGWSSPAVLGDRVWVTTATGEGKSLRAVSVDRESGKIVVDTEVFRLGQAGAIHEKNSHASPTPVLEGDRVYVHFGPQGTACLARDGRVVWRVKLPYAQGHGPGGSPVLYGDLLIVACDGTDVQYVVALDKTTGEVRWRKERNGLMAYSTPLVVRSEDADRVISVSGRTTVAYDPRTGKELWLVGYGDGFSNVPRPVAGHGLVYICTGFYQPEVMAVRLTDGRIAWRNGRATPLTPSPLVAGDEIYFVSDNGVASCLDARTGKEYWRQRLNGNFSASPVWAEGKIYWLSEDGEMTVIAAGRAFRKLAVNRLDGTFLASPAVAGGAIFLRSDRRLYRIGGQ